MDPQKICRASRLLFDDGLNILYCLNKEYWIYQVSQNLSNIAALQEQPLTDTTEFLHEFDLISSPENSVVERFYVKYFQY